MSTTTGQNCLQNTPEYGDEGEEVASLENDNLYLISAYTFSCHGNVTQWRACVEKTGVRYDILFYVFRPSTDPALPNCYTQISEDLAENPTQNDSCFTLNIPQVNQTSVQPGDVVGVLSMSNGTDDGIVLKSNVTGVTVWYAPVDSVIVGGAMCPYKTAPDGNLPLLVMKAPVITAVVGEPGV